MSNIQPTSEERTDSLDLEKNTKPKIVNANDSDLPVTFKQKITCWSKLMSMGIEERGIVPVPVEERTSDRFVDIFSIWFTMSVTPLAIVTGILGTFIFGLSLRDASLITIFFGIICTAPVAYLSTLGPKTGMRQLIQARYSFGLYGSSLLVLLNLATITGFVIISSVIGGTTLAAINPDSISTPASIAILSIIALFISFCGMKVLHQYERYAWFPAVVAMIIATGCGGKTLMQQAKKEEASTAMIFSYAGVIAGYLIPWAALASDFGIYIRPDAPSKRIFAYTYFGLLIPTVLLIILGAAIGGAIPNNAEWDAGYTAYSVGGVLVAMLSSAGGFGKFVAVILAFSVLGNMSASIYSISLNYQILHPLFQRVPRPLFAILTVAVTIPVSIAAASSFFAALENFIYLIAYWSASFVGIVIIEHVVFRKRDSKNYKHSIYDSRKDLPTGLAALGAAVLTFGLVIPCMSQVWWTGPVAKVTGDIGFEVALVLSAVLYVPLRKAEIRIRGRL
ncbi:hypothetical protein WAI453_001776 [Rhynchosporium graminicola]|uniref:Related to purine-cytosine permease n=1 Tax=Rhynchosporium graminicola TaxID=2792576 RepID=A0A1E1LPI9_9HELO|nr:related to purine-cytosine permease [Rhynchosporium commune]